jgi:hypothetical protein
MGHEPPSGFPSLKEILADYGKGQYPQADGLAAWAKACPRPDAALTAERLDGGWYAVLDPVEGPGARLHGPLRIEDHLATGEIRISGDFYELDEDGAVDPVRSLDRFRPNWYPHLPRNLEDWTTSYSLYLRSHRPTLTPDQLAASLSVHPWSRNRSDFGFPSRKSWLILNRDDQWYRHDGLPNTIKLFGQARLMDTRYRVTACKTSPYYRGCSVSVIEMAGTRWPRAADRNGRTLTFDGVFADHGIDIRLQFHDDDIRARRLESSSDDERLLNRLMSRSDGTWHVTMIVGTKGSRPCAKLSRNFANDRVLGVMRDDRQPFREYAIGFYNESIPDVLGLRGPDIFKLTPALRDDPIGTDPLAFLRTLLHEAGHVFGLLHSHEDLTIGRTLMNPTGDVLTVLKEGETYPDAAEYRFADAEATALVHAPDPQVAPGRGQYRWMPGLIYGVPLPPDLAWPDSPVQEVPLEGVFRRT